MKLLTILTLLLSVSCAHYGHSSKGCCQSKCNEGKCEKTKESCCGKENCANKKTT